MKTAFGTVVAIVISAAAVSGLGQVTTAVTHTLDLTRPDVVRTRPVHVEGYGSSGPRSVLPLELKLDRLDRAAYALDAPVVYELFLRNIGSESLVLPWSVDRAAIEVLPQRIQATITLQVTDPEGRNQSFGTETLEGSPGMPESLQTLLPGETAFIKIRSAVSLLGADARLWIASAGVVPVRATFTISDTPDLRWHPVVSANTIPISFRLPHP